nr:proton-conducting transporter membrane subunit [Candidatus Trichorickettsia mobilis]
MILENFITANFSVISTLIIGSVNLLTPFITKEDSNIRNILLLLISTIFLINIIIIDWLFLHGIRANIILFAFDHYAFSLHLEAVGIIFLNLLGSLWICALLYTTKYLVINNIANSSRFLFFFNLIILMGALLSLSANLFTMFCCYELLTLATIPLIIHVKAGAIYDKLYQYLTILMGSSMLLFFPAILIIYAKVDHGSFIYDGFIQDNFSDTQAIFLFLMFIFGISKAAIYPLHGWLPTAMVATYPVSALLHAVVVVKAGLFCIFKIIIYVFGLKYLHSLFTPFNWIILLPIITIFYSAFKGLQANNIKMILAYSTINQLALALLSAFMFTQKSIAAAILHMVSHSITKICLFFAAGSYYSINHTSQIKDLLGIKVAMPKTSLIMLIASLSLIGLPPFAGFISKFYIMLAAAQQQQLLIMVIIAISTILSALYMTKILIFIYKTNTPTNHNLEDKLPLSMLISIVICIAGVIGFFLIQKLISRFLVYI